MTGSNPFDDLDDVSGESETENAPEASSDSPSTADTESTTAPTTESNPSESPDPSDASEASDSLQESSNGDSGPSFDYSEVRQRPLYARGETWDEFEDAIGISVVPELRRQGIRDEEKREIHDAVLTLAAEEPERLVELIAERRREP